ncbi:hypothetical protein GQF01_00260 [Paenibacillus sp. 5J-6]|uniref:Methylamine utilisation protein MauE domain-containing protein n=1 Tax=Paenibacillus silvestris TaxID=2606219 RepID=A0A6L8UTU8_9BACL|nr:MauE/DoxX family redox-associated membrane protein [Paenibacillus silvestris]MZQ80589.1 hypothetical protein [Paenibacillus silvestris]
MQTLVSSIQIGLCLLFLISAVMKLIDLSTFVDLVQKYEVLPSRLSTLYGYTAPVIELAAGFMLLFAVTYYLGAVIILLLLLSFGYAVQTAIQKEKDISCGCYGKWLDSQADKFTLIKIFILILIDALLFVIHPADNPFSLPSLVFGAVGTVIFLVMQILWNYNQQNMKLF